MALVVFQLGFGFGCFPVGFWLVIVHGRSSALPFDSRRFSISSIARLYSSAGRVESCSLSELADASLYLLLWSVSTHISPVLGSFITLSVGLLETVFSAKGEAAGVCSVGSCVGSCVIRLDFSAEFHSLTTLLFTINLAG